MSEFNVVVIQIGKIGKHPNADSLSITHVLGNYPCIFKTGDFKEGDKAVYIPVDSIIPDNDKEFVFLGEHRRIKARKLRGIFSMGLLSHIRNQLWEVGRNVQKEYKIIKYESQIPINMEGEYESNPGLPKYTDIEGFRRWFDIIKKGEQIILTEKIHGTSSLFAYYKNRFWVGSHKTIKKENKNNLYWRIAYQYNLPELLKQYENYVFYGEIYGDKIQDLKYGCKLNEQKLVIFDISNLEQNKYLDWDQFLQITDKLKLPIPPILYKGIWNKNLIKYAEGLTTLNNAIHVREGFVVKPYQERWDDQIGRVILKYIGEGYYLRK